MPQYLINIAVGPVQEFIASARKLRDLWYGSYLLSELSKSVARSLTEQGCELIFPAISTADDLQADSELNVANKILALSPNEADPQVIVDSARQAFNSFWQKTCEEALTRAKKILPKNNIQEDIFKQQLNDFGEFFAAWTELDKDNYSESRQFCEQRLAGRKNLREFLAPSWNGTGKPKSSLDGIRESVFSQSSSDSYIVKKGEHLDALGIVKRFGPLNIKKRPYFDNMAQVAAQPYLQGLQKSAKNSRKIAEIIASLPTVEELYPVKDNRPPEADTAWDGWPPGLSSEVLFPSIIADEIKQRKNDPSQKTWKKMESAMKPLWRKTAEPLPYSCLLIGDGDNMGKTINQLTTIKQHQRFSAELDKFARNVHPLLKQYQGRVVYSGGDDVMAYVPLHNALECAEAINAAFADAMTTACAEIKIKQPTFSMGIVIVHQHMPLHQVLDLARTAEKNAKNEGGRNSLSIIQSKRSGTDLTIYGKWHKVNDCKPLSMRIKTFTELCSKGNLSSRLGYQLRGVVKECGKKLAWNQRDNARPDNVTTAEALRIIGRKRQQSGAELTQEDAAKLLAGQDNLRKVSDELIIAHQISESCNLASTDGFKETGR